MRTFLDFGVPSLSITFPFPSWYKRSQLSKCRPASRFPLFSPSLLLPWPNIWRSQYDVKQTKLDLCRGFEDRLNQSVILLGSEMKQIFCFDDFGQRYSVEYVEKIEDLRNYHNLYADRHPKSFYIVEDVSKVWGADSSLLSRMIDTNIRDAS